ncbi:MAG: hypothetical protein AAF701_06210, partial [Pseudomonadota bacterium]
ASGVKNESWVLELNRIQVAFAHLVKTFAETIDKRNKMMSRSPKAQQMAERKPLVPSTSNAGSSQRPGSEEV